jgi:subtilisin family serine protease
MEESLDKISGHGASSFAPSVSIRSDSRGRQKGILIMTLRRWSATTVGLLVFLPLLSVAIDAQTLSKTEKVLIESKKPYTQLISTIGRLGGRVTYEFEYVDGLAAEVPEEALETIRNIVGPNAIVKDIVIPAPSAERNRSRLMGRLPRRGSGSNRPVAGEPIFPEGKPSKGVYAVNTPGVNLRDLHLRGITGKDVIVAVLDSGIVPGYPALDSDESVICGFDMIGDDETCSPLNNGHGTFVAGMISANVALDLTDSFILSILKQHMPTAFDQGSNVLPLIGSAPQSKVYAIRVFDDLQGTNESVLIEAINRVIRLRRRADAGRSDGVNITVLNLSAGSVTLHAGRELLEQAIDALLDNDIVPVISMGNVGPSAITGGNPGTAYSALTVGATSHAANERVWRDYWGVGSSADRPTSPTQTYIFSSRGPDANGRLGLDVVASGDGNIGQGWEAPGDVSPESGTSYSAPIVAGVAALLRQAFPKASAAEIFNAIVEGSDPRLIQDGSTRFDRGHGLVNAAQAYLVLKTGRVPDQLPSPPRTSRSVEKNLENNADLDVDHGFARRTFEKLKPGERGEILFQIKPHTTSITLSITNFDSSDPLDDLTLFVHSAKTSSIGAFGDYLIDFFPTTGGSFVISDPGPEPGVMRITLMGSTYNLRPVSARVTVTEDVDPVPGATERGRIRDGQTIRVPVRIDEDGPAATFELAWENGWESYPTSDIDFFVTDPNRIEHTGGASLQHPERIVVPAPGGDLRGLWLVTITGFEVPGGSDKWKLRVIVNGKVVN